MRTGSATCVGYSDMHNEGTTCINVCYNGGVTCMSSKAIYSATCSGTMSICGSSL